MGGGGGEVDELTGVWGEDDVEDVISTTVFEEDVMSTTVSEVLPVNNVMSELIVNW